MAWEVKRKAELTLATLLTEALPDLTFYVSKGGDESGGSSLPKPPFGAVWIENAEKTIQNERTYLLTGTVVWVTRAEAKVGGDVAEHAEAVRLITNAVQAIGSGVDQEHSLVIHGIDVATVNEFSDNERQAHGDTISFMMGVSEID